MKVLLTGFDSFPGVEVNPSRLLVEAISQQDFDDIEVVTEILPVDYEYCRSWILSLSVDYDLIIHVGVACEAVENRLEVQAYNKCGPHLDVAGKKGPVIIDEVGEPILASTLPLEGVCAELSFPCQLSADAGDYLCNFIYYESLSKSHSKRVLFYHISPFEVSPLNHQMEYFLELLSKISVIG